MDEKTLRHEDPRTYQRSHTIGRVTVAWDKFTKWDGYWVSLFIDGEIKGSSGKGLPPSAIVREMKLLRRKLQAYKQAQAAAQHGGAEEGNGG